MRGGGEYGEKWHEAGTKLKKQNVFDDFIAAAEYLIKNKYTSPSRLAIQGGSMVVYWWGGIEPASRTLQGRGRTSGSDGYAAFPQFYHRVEFDLRLWLERQRGGIQGAICLFTDSQHASGVKYPATLITTADHDDRVVPAHNFKYAAALQAAQGGANPILIRIDTKSGHGASSTTKAIEQAADIYSFLMMNLGVTPQ